MFQCIYTEKCLPHGTILQFRFGQDTFCKVLRLNEKGGRCAPSFPKMPTFRFTDVDLCLQRCASSFLKMRIFGGERYASSGMKMRIFETGSGLELRGWHELRPVEALLERGREAAVGLHFLHETGVHVLGLVHAVARHAGRERGPVAQLHGVAALEQVEHHFLQLRYRHQCLLRVERGLVGDEPRHFLVVHLFDGLYRYVPFRFLADGAFLLHLVVDDCHNWVPFFF